VTSPESRWISTSVTRPASTRARNVAWSSSSMSSGVGVRVTTSKHTTPMVIPKASHRIQRPPSGLPPAASGPARPGPRSGRCPRARPLSRRGAHRRRRDPGGAGRAAPPDERYGPRRQTTVAGQVKASPSTATAAGTVRSSPWSHPNMTRPFLRCRSRPGSRAGAPATSASSDRRTQRRRVVGLWLIVAPRTRLAAWVCDLSPRGEKSRPWPTIAAKAGYVRWRRKR
jgi:hypothetical protein